MEGQGMLKPRSPRLAAIYLTMIAMVMLFWRGRVLLPFAPIRIREVNFGKLGRTLRDRKEFIRTKRRYRRADASMKENESPLSYELSQGEPDGRRNVAWRTSRSGEKDALEGHGVHRAQIVEAGRTALRQLLEAGEDRVVYRGGKIAHLRPEDEGYWEHAQ